LCWRDVELDAAAQPAAQLRLDGAVRQAAERAGVRGVHVTVSRTGQLAMASVLLET
jgi:phosphopantetheinyl transferase (holo-ACP synthase)